MKNRFFSALVLALGLSIACQSQLGAQEYALSTNFLDYANFGTLNIEASYGIAQHWSLSAGVKYNPFTYGKGLDALQNRQRSFIAGARYWPWHVFSAWWLSGMLRYQEYNAGGISSPQTAEGERYGGGISAGYTYMLSPFLNLDFGIGFWSGYESYTVYSCQTCGSIVDKGKRAFLLPSELTLALTYIF